MKESEAVELKRSLAELKDRLRRIHTVKAYGRGMPVILKNEPTVQFREIAKIFITSFDRLSYAEDAERATQETTQETTQEKILTCIKADPVITRNQTSAKVGLTEDGIKYHLSKLTKSGIIRHVGPTKAGRWEVKSWKTG